jgi:hypothetical protein
VRRQQKEFMYASRGCAQQAGILREQLVRGFEHKGVEAVPPVKGEKRETRYEVSLGDDARVRKCSLWLARLRLVPGPCSAAAVCSACLLSE